MKRLHRAAPVFLLVTLLLAWCLCGCAASTAESAPDLAGLDVSSAGVDPDGTPGSTPEAEEPVVLQHLQGEMITTSPDGITSYGPPVSVLAKRTLAPQEGQIIEETWHGAEYSRSTFTLRSDTLVFDVEDDAGTFEGTITLDGPDWSSSGLTYDLQMTDGSGSLTGTGTWEDGTFSTDKLFSDPSGVPQAKIRDTLLSISEDAFTEAVTATGVE